MGKVILGALVDVSAGGLRLVGSALPLLPGGTAVDVSIELVEAGGPTHMTGAVKLEGRGVILRVQPSKQAGAAETAVRFTGPLSMRGAIDLDSWLSR